MTFDVPESRSIDIEALKQNIQAYVKFLVSYPTILKREHEMEKEYTDMMLDRFAGCWHGDESADQIMSQVRQGQTIREPLIL